MASRYELEMVKGIFPVGDGLDLYNRILSEQFDEERLQIQREEEQEIIGFIRCLGITKKRGSRKNINKKRLYLRNKNRCRREHTRILDI